MKKDTKYIKSISRIFLMSVLLVSLGACSGEKNQYQKGESVMLDEIYKIKTNPGKAEMIEGIIAKYFPIGSDKAIVLENLNNMKIDITEDKERNAVYVLHQDKPAYVSGSKTLEISFYFNKNNKLDRLFARIYNTI